MLLHTKCLYCAFGAEHKMKTEVSYLNVQTTLYFLEYTVCTILRFFMSQDFHLRTIELS